MTHKDPVKRFQELLLAHDVAREQDATALDERVKLDFESGYEFALASPFPEPGDVTKGLWVEDGYWKSEPGRGGGTGT
jgi:TPP-dependent pyruvate/acetoin dehydrogenase alpha subunit